MAKHSKRRGDIAVLGGKHSSHLSSLRCTARLISKLEEVKKLIPGAIKAKASRIPPLQINLVAGGLEVVFREQRAQQVLHVYTDHQVMVQRHIEDHWNRKNKKSRQV